MNIKIQNLIDSASCYDTVRELRWPKRERRIIKWRTWTWNVRKKPPVFGVLYLRSIKAIRISA